MAHERTQRQSHKNLARVRELFMREWDPIGVADEPAARDEYDRYVAKAYIMLLDERATAEEIAAYLLDIATTHMGLSKTAAGVENCERTAQMLIAMRPEFEAL